MSSNPELNKIVHNVTCFPNGLLCYALQKKSFSVSDNKIISSLLHVGYNGPGTGGKVSLYIIILKALFCKTIILLISLVPAEPHSYGINQMRIKLAVINVF